MTDPDRVAELCRSWRLERDPADVLQGSFHRVVLVRRRGVPCALRVSEPGHDLGPEVAALRTWAGRGAVRLLDVHPVGDAVLLERLDPARSLHALPLAQAVPVAGELLLRLDVPAPAGLPPLADVAAAFIERTGERDARLGHPVPAGWLDHARTLAATLPTDADRLVHGDLHWGNVLADGAGGWRAIDPKPLAGDPAVGVAELMWTRLDELPDAAAVRGQLAQLSEAAGLDRGRVTGWTVVRAVDYWLWGLERGLTEDPVRCARLVGSVVQRGE